MRPSLARQRRTTVVSFNDLSGSRRTNMPAFITLGNFTDQGARNIKESPERFEAFKSMAEAAGITVKSVHWTTGAYDLVLVTEGPEEAVMALTIQTAAL